jgi:hypothetical protein
MSTNESTTDYHGHPMEADSNFSPNDFIACGMCEVWQHVGYLRFSSAMYLEDYFCEICGSDLHAVLENSRG